MDNDLKTTVTTFTVQLCGGEALTPVDLVAINGAKRLTLTARFAFDALPHNADGSGIATPHKCFTIRLTVLNFSHAGNERLARAT